MNFYIAIGQNCWGRGEDPESAKKEARKNGLGFNIKGQKKGYGVYVAPVEEEKSLYVDEMGNLHYEKELFWLSGPNPYDKTRK